MTNRLWVATRKGLFGFQRRSSKRWELETQAFIGDPVTMILPDSREDVFYAALNLGHFGVKLHRSGDKGKNWEEIAVPKYPQTPEPDEEENGDSLVQVWSLEEADPQRPGTLWAGTIPGGLFRSDDRGASWTLNQALWDRPERANWFGGGYDHPGIHSICVDRRNSHRLIVGVSCGGVWLSENDGESWACRADGMFAEYMPPERREDPSIQDPHRVAQSPSRPDVLWAQHHNGVFRSCDRAQSWQAVTGIRPSDFGFAVAIHPTEPDLVFLAPAVKDECRVPVDGRFVVVRTRDGGESFQVLDRGLPAPPSYDLIYRHCLEFDSAGEVLAMGSTTGGLWVTEDQGEEWHAISTHLPPVYCLRFG